VDKRLGIGWEREDGRVAMSERGDKTVFAATYQYESSAQVRRRKEEQRMRNE
jgi:hypothetical protein